MTISFSAADGEFRDGYGTTVRAGRFLRAGAECQPGTADDGEAR